MEGGVEMGGWSREGERGGKERGRGAGKYLHVMCVLEGCDGSSFHEELIYTDQSSNVSTRYVLNGFYVTSHHQDCPVMHQSCSCKLAQTYMYNLNLQNNKDFEDKIKTSEYY